MNSLRDYLWTFNCTVNSDRQDWGITKDSHITPIGCAEFLNVPNILMVLPPSENEASQVAHLKRIVWRLTFEKGFDFSRELEGIQSLAQTHSNIEGIIIDDLSNLEIERDGMQPGHLEKLRHAIHSSQKPLDLWGVFYTMNMDYPLLRDFVPMLDVITLWTWNSDHLDHLEQNLERCEKLAAGKRILLGIYIYDYHNKKPVPIPRMQFQCEKAFEWLQQRRLAGMIFLGNTVMDLGFESAAFAQNWIREKYERE
ncbi:hypothetical protein JXJ21_01905 [candidate division KSB1 bacterium]|nr:hypothetical protein [candidate division KSB1 bacterium]